MDTMFSLLVDKGHIIFVDSPKALEASSYVSTPDGYDFVFSGAVPKKIFCSKLFAGRNKLFPDGSVGIRS
jgi:hypothetical protein